MATKRICSIPGCDKTFHARDLCSTHYSRWRSNGDPMVVRQGKPKSRPFEELFWKCVPVRVPGECWEWRGFRDKDGYGKKTRKGKSPQFAHRISWELSKGPIPVGMCICHACDNPGCVNPGHLFVGSHAENSADRDRKGRANTPKGARNGKALLTENDVRSIRRLLDGGREQKEIAVIYGVSNSAIQNIWSGKNWSWLE